MNENKPHPDDTGSLADHEAHPYDDEAWDDDDEDAPWQYDQHDSLGEWTCLFPGECCMPGPHYASECHTAQMAQEFFEELEPDHQPHWRAHRLPSANKTKKSSLKASLQRLKRLYQLYFRSRATRPPVHREEQSDDGIPF